MQRFSSETDGKAVPMQRVEEITGKCVTFYKCDLMDGESVLNVFKKVIW